MLFSFYFVSYKEKETFKNYYKIFQNRKLKSWERNVKYNKYDQIKEFIPDTYNYDIEKDSGIIRSIDNPAFSADEYLNLNKIKIKEEQLKNWILIKMKMNKLKQKYWMI